jgi:hypothetical protein
LLVLFYGNTDCLGGYWDVLRNSRTQRILDGVLALPCGQLQNLKIFAGGSPGAPILA